MSLEELGYDPLDLRSRDLSRLAVALGMYSSVARLYEFERQNKFKGHLLSRDPEERQWQLIGMLLDDALERVEQYRKDVSRLMDDVIGLRDEFAKLGLEPKYAGSEFHDDDGGDPGEADCEEGCEEDCQEDWERNAFARGAENFGYLSDWDEGISHPCGKFMRKAQSLVRDAIADGKIAESSDVYEELAPILGIEHWLDSMQAAGVDVVSNAFEDGAPGMSGNYWTVDCDNDALLMDVFKRELDWVEAKLADY